MSSMFEGCLELKEVPHFDTSSVTNMSFMLNGCLTLKEVPQFDTSRVENMKGMFYVCSSLKEVPKFDTSQVKDMGYMFKRCSELKTVLFADKIKDLEATKLPFLEELKTLPEAIKVKLLMDTSDFKDKKVQAMIKLYKD
jgi:surface protein